jgi:hypothetical protein
MVWIKFNLILNFGLDNNICLYFIMINENIIYKCKKLTDMTTIMKQLPSTLQENYYSSADAPSADYYLSDDSDYYDIPDTHLENEEVSDVESDTEEDQYNIYNTINKEKRWWKTHEEEQIATHEEIEQIIKQTREVDEYIANTRKKIQEYVDNTKRNRERTMLQEEIGNEYDVFRKMLEIDNEYNKARSGILNMSVMYNVWGLDEENTLKHFTNTENSKKQIERIVEKRFLQGPPKNVEVGDKYYKQQLEKTKKIRDEKEKIKKERRTLNRKNNKLRKIEHEKEITVVEVETLVEQKVVLEAVSSVNKLNNVGKKLPREQIDRIQMEIEEKEKEQEIEQGIMKPPPIPYPLPEPYLYVKEVEVYRERPELPKTPPPSDMDGFSIEMKPLEEEQAIVHKYLYKEVVEFVVSEAEQDEEEDFVINILKSQGKKVVFDKLVEKKKTMKDKKKNKKIDITQDLYKKTFEQNSKKAYEDNRKTILCKSVLYKQQCHHRKCFFAHTIVDFVPKNCNFPESCKNVEYVCRGIYKNINKDKKTCIFLHKYETKEMLLKRVFPEVYDANVVVEENVCVEKNILVEQNVLEEQKVVLRNTTKTWNMTTLPKVNVSFTDINRQDISYNMQLINNNTDIVKPNREKIVELSKKEHTEKTYTNKCKIFCKSLFTKSRCPHGVKCNFAHRPEELLPTKCNFGSRCYLVHIVNGKLENSGSKVCTYVHEGEDVKNLAKRLGL